MTALVIILLIMNIVLVFLLARKWVEGAPGEPRGGEKPLGDFFRARPESGSPAPASSGELEIAERLLDRIDRKIDVLRELMRQADSKIESLGRAGVSSPREIGFGEQTPERQRTRNGAEGRREPAAQAQNEDDRRARIVALRRRGMSSAQIAKEVEIGRGEVDLILNIEGLG